MRRASLALALALAFSSTRVLAQSSDITRPLSGITRPLSATVMATYAARNGGMTLLVLWRGEPGWHTQAGGRSSGGGGGGDAASFYLTRGNRTLSVDIDYVRGVATVLGQSISLQDTNVLLVDGVTMPAGGTIVGLHFVDVGGSLDGSPATSSVPSDPVIAAVRRLPEAAAFLQCDVPMPPPPAAAAAGLDPAVRIRIGEYAQQTMTAVCLAAAGAPAPPGR